MQKKISTGFRNILTKFNFLIINSAWLLTEKFNRAVLGLIVGAWVARYLGPSKYGELAYAVVYVNFFQAIVNLGTDGIVVRDITNDPHWTHEILGTTLCMRLITGIAFWAISVLIITGHQELDASSFVIYLTLGSAVFFQAFDTIDLWFQSQNKNKQTVWAKLIAHSSSNLIKVILILNNAKVEYFALAIAVDGMLVAIGLMVNYNFNRTQKSWSFNTNRATKILRESWPYIISGVATMLYMRIDQFMIQKYIGTQALGIYAVAIPISQVWYVIPMTLCTSLAPYIANQKLKGEIEYQQSLLTIFRSFGVVSICISISIFLASKEIVALMYGPEFMQSADILAIHIFTNIFVFQNLAQYLWTVNESKGIIQTAQTLIGAITALICNLFLIPKFGIIGSAYSSLIAYAVSGVISNAIFAPNILLMQCGINPNFKIFHKSL